MKRRAALVTLGLLLAAGCVTPVSETELEQRLERAAGTLTRAGARRVIPIHAETKFVAWALVAEARSDRASAPSVQLGHRIELAARRGMDVVVGGPYPDLTDQLMLNALSQPRDRPLGGIKLVLVSAEPPSPELAQAARRAGARLYHRDYR